MTLRFTGGRDPERRELVEAGTWRGPREAEIPEPMREYRKTATTFAVRIDEPFEVETLEGLMAGQAGDFLACGVAGELYPIDAAVMAASYTRTVLEPGFVAFGGEIPVEGELLDRLTPDELRAMASEASSALRKIVARHLDREAPRDA